MASSSNERNPVERLAEEFASRLRRGERPALSEYTARYPQYAEQIEELFPALVVMEQLKPAGETLPAPRVLRFRRKCRLWNALAITGSCGRSAAAAWEWSTKRNSKR